MDIVVIGAAGMRGRKLVAAMIEKAGWPQNFSARRTAELGFKAEQNFDEIIRVHIEDELGNALPR